MANNIVSSVLTFFAVVMCFQNYFVYSFTVTISPEEITDLKSEKLSISCNLDDSDAATMKEVVLLEIRTQNKPLASIRRGCTEVTIGEDLESKIEAGGEISPVVKKSHLSVKLVTDPRKKNTGSYTCVVFYLNNDGVLLERKQNSELTNFDVKVVVEAMQERVSDLEEEVKQQKKKVKARDDRLDKLEKKVKAKDDQVLANRVAELERQLQNQGQVLEQREDRYNTTEMFTATAERAGPFPVGEVFHYSTVLDKQGEGYDKVTGVFTAPVDGFYWFQISALVYPGRYMFVDLRTNTGRTLTRIFSGNHLGAWEDYASGSCIARLKAGEEVKPIIQLTTKPFALSGYYSGDLLNQFTGFLLKAL